MNANEEYERVARRLDGEPSPLTPAEEALARDIQADLAKVAPALNVAMPAGVLHRVNAGLGQPARLAPARKKALIWRIQPWLSAAAGAAVFVAAILTPVGPGGKTIAQMLTLPDGWDLVPATEFHARADALAQEMAEEHRRLEPDAWPMELAVAGLEQDLTDAAVGDVIPGLPSVPDDKN
jgi:hypothetical protein